MEFLMAKIQLSNISHTYNPNDLNPNGWETHFVIGQQF